MAFAVLELMGNAKGSKWLSVCYKWLVGRKQREQVN